MGFKHKTVEFRVEVLNMCPPADTVVTCRIRPLRCGLLYMCSRLRMVVASDTFIMLFPSEEEKLTHPCEL